MEEEFTKEGIERQKTLIGEFVIVFEKLNEWMRIIIQNVILDYNSTNLQLRNIETLLTDISSDQLRSKFDSLIIDNFSSFPKFISSIKTLSTKVSQLSTIRNTIVHGSYRLGWKNFYGELSDETFSLRHSKSTKKGYEKRSHIISTDDLTELIRTLRIISSCYTSIEVIIKNIKMNRKPSLIQREIEIFVERTNSIETLKLKYLDILN